MKWNIKVKNDLKLNDERIINKFLFFPLILNNQGRWLCKVKILQKVKFVYVEGYINGEYKNNWINDKFL